LPSCAASPPALVVTGGSHPHGRRRRGHAGGGALEIDPVVLPLGRHNVTLAPDALNPLLERLWSTAEAGR
jgi:hypothetical protein